MFNNGPWMKMEVLLINDKYRVCKKTLITFPFLFFFDSQLGRTFIEAVGGMACCIDAYAFFCPSFYLSW